MTTAQFAMALACCSIAVVTDLRSRRVPNWLTLPLPLVAVAFALPGGLASTAREIALVAVLIAAGIALHASGVFGGGDVKLLAGVAALLGYPLCVAFVLYTAIVGGLLALAAAFLRRRGGELLRNVGAALLHGGVSQAPSSQTIPYAVAIAAGLVVTILSMTYVPALRIPL